MRRPQQLAWLILAVFGGLWDSEGSGAERVIEDFPVVVRCGLAATPLVAGVEGSLEEALLPDLPFGLDRGYGYVGGRPGRLEGSLAFGGILGDGPRRESEIVWREGVEKYLFRVPRGEYLVEAWFLESDVCHAGLRVFDVEAEGQALFPGVDIAGEVGDFAWLRLRGLVSVYDGWLDLRFRSEPSEYPARISGIRLRRSPAEPALEAPLLEVHQGAGWNLLRWSPDRTGVVSGYEVARADIRQGPYRPLSKEPIPARWWEDTAVEPAREYYYRVRAVDVRGRRGPASAPLRAVPGDLGRLGLKTYELRVAPDDLRRISVRAEPAPVAPGELRYLGAVYHVDVSLDTSREGWRRKKSLHLRIQRDRSPRIGRRSDLFLSAEAADPTRLRELIGSEVCASVGVAAPVVEPIGVVLNGSFLGLYFEIEPIDEEFLRRVERDRVGLLARRTKPDVLDRSWAAYGERIGESGNLWSLTKLVHELHCVHEGELAEYLDATFYLDRHLERSALCALAGVSDRADALAWLLRDSRNGRWELFQARHRDGEWGLRDDGASPPAITDDLLATLLFGPVVDPWAEGRDTTSAFEVLLFGSPDLRRKLLGRIRLLAERDLTPEGLREISERSLSRIRAALLEDVARWPGPMTLERILGTPERVEDRYRQRLEGLLRMADAAGGETEAPGLEIREVMAQPDEGSPWVEVLNAGDRSIRLRDYCLVEALDAAEARASGARGWVPLPDRDLAPNERAVVELPARTRRYLAVHRLSRGGVGARPVGMPLDRVLLGYATTGASFGRVPGRPEHWGHLESATPGESNEGRSLASPPIRFLQGAELTDEGDVSVWLRVSATSDAGSLREARVFVADDDRGFVASPMTWDDGAYRYVARLPKPSEPRPFFFVATSRDGIDRGYPLPAPDLTYRVPVLPEIRINEVLPRPLRTPGAPGEFIELFNASTVEVDLGGCFLTDTQRNTAKWRIPQGTRIAPKGFALFYADGLNTGNHTSFKLSNAGEFLGLYGRMEEGNLAIHRLAFRGTRTGESWGASPDGSQSFRAWRDPTPGARNIPKVPEEYLEGAED